MLLIVLAVLAVLAAWWLWKERRIDACSAGGGEWNYSAGACGPRA
ncbi:MAG TPA: hypothetical protein VLK25_10825 [Allosphingosinicella sp.]|nr:hypothetical protein [Allosphingosinicella sp.]